MDTKDLYFVSLIGNKKTSYLVDKGACDAILEQYEKRNDFAFSSYDPKNLSRIVLVNERASMVHRIEVRKAVKTVGTKSTRERSDN